MKTRRVISVEWYVAYSKLATEKEARKTFESWFDREPEEIFFYKNLILAGPVSEKEKQAHSGTYEELEKSIVWED